MADQKIGDLPKAPQVDPESLLVMEQQGEAYSLTGQQIAEFARGAVKDYVESAKNAAISATNSEKAAKISEEETIKAAESAGNDAKDAAENARVASKSAAIAKQYGGNPAKPINGTWWIWNAESQEYVDTGEPSDTDFVLDSIAVYSPPKKTVYKAGDPFDPTGMIVEASHTNGISFVVASVSWSPEYLTGDTENITIKYTEKGITKTVLQPVSVEPGDIYGAIWSGGYETTWSRTDAAETFVNPVPFVNNGSNKYGSPFDDMYPWAGVKRVTDPVLGNLVEYPKYWFKIEPAVTLTKLGLSIKISASEHEGFFVSPSHADRGDGKGERDFAYIGRYKCDSSYKSVSGSMPIVNVSRDEATRQISKLDKDAWIGDFANFWTYRLLYLVEYGDWNSQSTISMGTTSSAKLELSGQTDEMPYHTGTMEESINTPTSAFQYRYLESPWGNGGEWIGGLNVVGNKLYCVNNPADFETSANGEYISDLPTKTGEIQAFGIPSNPEFVWALFPSEINAMGAGFNYVSDYYNYYSGGKAVASTQNLGGTFMDGLFRLGVGYSASEGNNTTSCRLQKLP